MKKIKKYTIKICWISLFILSILFVTSVQADSKTTQVKNPNIVLIIIDDLGYGQMSCYPHFQDVHTPNLDALADQGIRMTQAYSNDPMCAPTRKSLRSGYYFQRSSIGTAKDAIGKYFSDNGYMTACIGKTQFSENPVDLGFNEFFGFRAGLHDYFESRIPTVEAYRHLMQLVPKMGVPVKMSENGLMYNIQRYSPILHNKEPVEEFEYLTTEFTNRAIDWIERNKNNPFFLYLSYNAVHHPHQVPEKYLNKRNPDATVEDAEAQLAQIDCLDDEIGRFLTALGNNGLKEKTLIIVLGDNGGLSFKGANWKLRGHKSQLFEGGIRIPWIISWPGVLPEGVTYDKPVIHMDLVPTLIDAAKLDVNQQNFDGKNLLPYWKEEGKEAPHGILFWGRPGKGYAVRKGDWKYIHVNDQEPALYNLNDDISESDNKIKTKPEIADQLKTEISVWKQNMESEKN